MALLSVRKVTDKPLSARRSPLPLGEGLGGEGIERQAFTESSIIAVGLGAQHVRFDRENCCVARMPGMLPVFPAAIARQQRARGVHPLRRASALAAARNGRAVTPPSRRDARRRDAHVDASPGSASAAAALTVPAGTPSPARTDLPPTGARGLQPRASGGLPHRFVGLLPTRDSMFSQNVNDEQSVLLGG